MEQGDRISQRQFIAMSFVAILSPLIRRFPRVLAETAGRSAWLSIPLCAVPAAAAIGVAYLLFRRGAAAGFSGLLCRVFGRIPGRILSILYSLWLLFYAGFLLRSGALRFSSTVYAGAKPWLFIVLSLLLCTAAAFGRLQTLARAAMIFRPLLVAVFVAAAFLTFQDIDFRLLLPVTADDLLPNGFAALKTVNVLSVAGYLAFLGDRLEGRLRPRDYLGWAAALLVIVGLMTVCCIGVFGPVLTAKLAFPFFMLVRDVTVLGSLERAEPVVIALWVFSDFILVSLLLQIAAKNLRESFGFLPGGKQLELANGRWLIPVCAALAAAAALLTARNVASFSLLSEVIVPLANALMVFALPVAALLVGLLRRKL